MEKKKGIMCEACEKTIKGKPFRWDNDILVCSECYNAFFEEEKTKYG